MTLPDKIWVEAPDIFDGMGFWMDMQAADRVEYVRADIAAARIRELEAQLAALAMLAD